MKRFLVGLCALICTTLAIAILALRMGWVTWDRLRQVVLHPSPIASATVLPRSAPLPTRDRSILRVAIDDRASTLPFVALQDFIKSHGNDLRIALVRVADARLRWQMLAAGRVDVACGTLDSFVLGQIRHDCGLMLFKLSTSKGMDVLLAADGVQDMRGLAGKRVAVVAGSGGSYLLGYFLDQARLSPSEVTVIEADDPKDAAQLLKRGAVQAAWLWPPHVREAGEGFHVLVDTTNVENVLDDVCVASHAAFNEHNAELLAFTRHWFEFESLLKYNPGLGHELVARNANIPAATVGKLLSNLRYYDLEDNQKLEDADVVNEMRRIQEFWRIMRAPNVNGGGDLARAVRVDVTHEIEIQPPASIFGSSPRPTPRVIYQPSSTPTAAPEASPDENTASPDADEN